MRRKGKRGVYSNDTIKSCPCCSKSFDTTETRKQLVRDGAHYCGNRCVLYRRKRHKSPKHLFDPRNFSTKRRRDTRQAAAFQVDIKQQVMRPKQYD